MEVKKIYGFLSVAKDVQDKDILSWLEVDEDDIAIAFDGDIVLLRWDDSVPEGPVVCRGRKFSASPCIPYGEYLGWFFDHPRKRYFAAFKDHHIVRFWSAGKRSLKPWKEFVL